MNEQSTYLVRAVTGPIILITIGVLFAFDRFTEFRFSQTWPILLIVVGLLKLIGGGIRRYRFPGDLNRPPQPPSGQPTTGSPGQGSTQGSGSSYQGPGSYQSSSYRGPGARQ